MFCDFLDGRVDVCGPPSDPLAHPCAPTRSHPLFHPHQTHPNFSFKELYLSGLDFGPALLEALCEHCPKLRHLGLGYSDGALTEEVSWSMQARWSVPSPVVMVMAVVVAGVLPAAFFSTTPSSDTCIDPDGLIYV